MHFLRYPNPLWFWNAGSGSEIQKSATLAANVTISVTQASIAFTAVSGSTIAHSVSAGYNISLSARDVTSVQVELSGFAYNVTASTNTSLLAYLSADSLDGGYERLNAYLTVTPVYTLGQTGQVSHSISAAYNVTASAGAGSLAAYLSASGTYNISASTSATLLSSDQYSASIACNISASVDIQLNVTQAAVSLNPQLAGLVSASMTPTIVIDRGGGLVWGRRKKKRYPIKIGYPLR